MNNVTPLFKCRVCGWPIRRADRSVVGSPWVHDGEPPGPEHDARFGGDGWDEVEEACTGRGPETTTCAGYLPLPPEPAAVDAEAFFERGRHGGACPHCGRIMSRREAAEQGACNDCHEGAGGGVLCW